jgi:hypothetical protein
MVANVRERVPIEARSLTVQGHVAAIFGRPSRVAVPLFFGIATVLLVWSRLANLQTPFWNDEAVMALIYSAGGPDVIFDGDHYIPNNHVLFSLTTWVTRRTLGEFEAAYRLWSVVPALAAVGLVAWWARRSLGTATAVLVFGLAVVSPMHYFLAPQARGYGLAMLAGAGMLIGALRTDRQEAADGWVLFACSGIVGIWTLPVFALPFVAQVAVLLTRPRLRRMTVLVVGVVGAASLVFYSPLLRAILDESDQEFGDVLHWPDLVTAPYDHLFHPTIDVLIPDSILSLSTRDATVAIVVTSTVVLLAVIRLVRENRFLLMNLVVPIAGTYAAFLIGRFHVAPRFVSPLFFHVVVLLAVGGSVVWSSASRWRAPRVMALAAGGERLRLDQKPESSWRYCFLPGGFIFVIVHGWGAEIPDTSCLRYRGGVRMDIPQQQYSPVGARGQMEIWIVPPPTSATPAASATRPTRPCTHGYSGAIPSPDIGLVSLS